ncbi:MAG: GNAT family N-acetyltransferase [Deltaproteobacteria bacterium]|nr:GNAT family N-acetyltransferase [Deltaproteobacteria bacterium]
MADLIYEELNLSDYTMYRKKILSLFIDTFLSNFTMDRKEAVLIGSERIELLEKYISNGTALVIGCIDDDELIGVVWAYEHIFFGESRMHVNFLAVDDKFRNQGVGKGLLLVVEERARKSGLTSIDLFVSEMNDAGLKFYSNNEFKTERRYLRKKL